MEYQLFINILNIWYVYISLPILIFSGFKIFYKLKTKLSLVFAISALLTSAGSLFNRLFPWQSFIQKTEHSLPFWAEVLNTFSLSLNLLGFNILIICLVLIIYKYL